MLNNTSWLWKGKAEQHGWGDRSAHFAWEMHQNRGEHRWSQGRFCYLALCCLFIKRRRGPWVMSVFCFVFPIALHCYAHSYSAAAGNFLTYTKECNWICVEEICGEQNCVWPKTNFVSPFQNLLSTCAFTLLCFLNLKEGHFSVVFPRLTLHFLHCVLMDRTHECWTTGSYCLFFPGWWSGLIVSCSWKKPWSLTSGLFWMLAFQFPFH